MLTERRNIGIRHKIFRMEIYFKVRFLYEKRSTIIQSQIFFDLQEINSFLIDFIYLLQKSLAYHYVVQNAIRSRNLFDIPIKYRMHHNSCLISLMKRYQHLSILIAVGRCGDDP